MSERRSHEIFVSYSHHDAAWCQRLFDDYINTTFGDCRIWTDAQIRVGEQWSEEIRRRLECSTVAVLLVSGHFLASRFIMDREFPKILERARSASLCIVWLPIGVAPAELAQRPELQAIQCAAGFDDPLPATPQDCPPGTLERIRHLVHDRLLSAVDPVGAELIRLVDRRYQVEHWLGEGSLAAIYKARDRVLERDVAIKVLKDKDQRSAFMADVHDAIRTSEEPNFVNVYDAASAEVTAYCVVQHIRGKNLAEHIRQHPRGFPVETLRKVFRGVTSAIARAHALGVTYGNIKPSNIILDDNNEPFVLPVGRRRDPARDAARLQALIERLAPGGTGETGETTPHEADLEDLAYLVPDHFGEQIEPVDPQLADQYMLGLLVYEMATGERPVLVAEPARLLSDGRSAFGELPSITDRRRLCPQRVAAIVARMAARRPSRRYPNLEAVLMETRLLDDLSLVIARDSYRRCTTVAAFDRQFFARFYDEFLRRSPNARPLFERFRADDWTRQHRMLKEAILLLFAFRQQNDGAAEPNVLSRVADTHRGIPAPLYDDFVDALVAVICGDAARGVDPFDPEAADRTQRDALEEHWRAALEPGVSYMRGRSTLAPSAAA